MHLLCAPSSSSLRGMCCTCCTINQNTKHSFESWNWTLNNFFQATMHFFLVFGAKRTLWLLRSTQYHHIAGANCTLWRYNVSSMQGKWVVPGFSWQWHPNTVQLRPAENWWNENIIIPTNAINLVRFSDYLTIWMPIRAIHHDYFQILESQCSCRGKLSSKG